MSLEAVKTYLAQYGAAGRVLEFSQSSATVELAAKAAGVIPARIAKTLSFVLAEGCLLVVTAGDARVDNAKFKAAFGQKARMLEPGQAPERIGHPVGGVCPFAVKEGVRVVLDASLRRFSTVYPACGSANSAIELSCDELFALSRAEGWVDVCRGWGSAPAGGL